MEHLLDFMYGSPIDRDNLTIADDNNLILYPQFRNIVIQIASELKKRDIHKGDRVAVYLERDVNSIIAVSAILLINAIYIPLNLKYPLPRLEYILNDTKTKLIIGKTDVRLNYDFLNIHESLSAYNSEHDSITPFSFNCEEPAAILYTSGSTGKPKGVVLSHKAMLAFVNWCGQTFRINPNDKIASLAPLNFDLSIFDIFTSLRYGASIRFIPDNLTMSPTMLTQWLAEEEITAWYTVPSMLTFWVNKGQVDKLPLPKLRTILFAGEPINTKTLLKLIKVLPQIEFFNLFGPTETNVCTYWEVKNEKLLEGIPIPIGVAACGNQLKIKEENNELLVRGPTLMTGYWIDGKINRLDSKTWYRTGDKVDLNESGEYLYKGRLDKMIKHFGYRIEPGEIEAVINNSINIQDCKVIGFKDKGGLSVIGVFLVTTDKELSISSLQSILVQKLPKYMVPTVYYLSDSLPKLHNGKTDLLQITKLLEKAYE